MKILQVHTFFQNYLSEFYQRHPHLVQAPFKDQVAALSTDGYSGAHIIAPSLEQLGCQTHLVISSCLPAQIQWLRETGQVLRHQQNWEFEIVKKQVEYYQPDVLYITHAIGLDSRFIRTLSWKPRLVIGWWGANIPQGTDWREFDVLLSNSKTILYLARKLGAKAVEWYYPGFPQYLAQNGAGEPKEWDLVFCGTLSRDHLRRYDYIKKIVKIARERADDFSLGLFISPIHIQLDPEIDRYNHGVRWGMDMYRTLKKARVAINIDIDGEENEAGNMRVFEVTGMGSFLLTEYHRDIETYFRPGIEIETFRDFSELMEKTDYYLQHPDQRETIAQNGQARCFRDYSLARRAKDFLMMINKHIQQKAPAAIPYEDTRTAFLETIIAPEIKDDKFYYAIQKIVKEEDIQTVLEIGSSAGAGSTEAFVSGIRDNAKQPTLYCMEISRSRFARLQRKYQDNALVKCYNVSSVPVDQFPSEAEIIQFYRTQRSVLNNYPLDRVLGWLRRDIQYVKESGVPGNGIQQIKQDNGIVDFDVVLIDGGEYTGKAELDEIYGAGIIMLDDIKGYKNYDNFMRLKADPTYTLIDLEPDVRHGYAIFRRVGKVAGRDIKIAEDYDHAGTRIDTESEFSKMIEQIFREKRPQKIIETGTYLGTGTTRIIADALRRLNIKDATFFTIEVNPDYHRTALQNLASQGLTPLVTPLNGVSIPRRMLPELRDIEAQCVNHIEFDGIFVDHQEKQRSMLYFKETDFRQVPDDLLDKCLEHFDYRPDFVLLDSAGHMGNIEFHYVIDKLKKPCIIALDDIDHIKHHKSFLQMQKDPRFTFIAVSREKFGFCIAEFTPGDPSAPQTVSRDDPAVIDKSFISSMGEAAAYISTLRLEKMFLDDLLSITYLSEDRSAWKPEPVIRSMPYRGLNGNREAYAAYAEKYDAQPNSPAALGELRDRVRQCGYPYRHQYIVVYGDQPYIRHGRPWAAILRNLYGNIAVPVVRVLFKPGFDQWRITPPSDARPLVLDVEATRNILFIRLDAIGDTVLAAAVLPHLKSRFPRARICVLCQKHVAEIYEAIPQVDDVMAIDKLRAYRDETHLAGIVSQLQHQAFDLALHTTWSREPIGDYLTISSQARRTVGLLGDHCNLPAAVMEKHNAFYSHLIPSPGEHRPELVRLRDFLNGLGNPCDHPGDHLVGDHLVPEFPLTPGDVEFANAFFERNRLDPSKTMILIAGTLTSNRTYDAYGSALDPICRDGGFSVVALGSQKDWKLSQHNLDAIGGRTFNLCGRTSIRQAAALIKPSRLVVGAETGLAHIACAVGTPNVVLLGGGHFGRFMPYTPLTAVACLPLDCYYCNWHCKHTRPHCVWDIQPEVIRTAVLESLAGPSEAIRIFTQDTSLRPPGENGPAWKFPDHLIHWDNVEIRPVSGMAEQHRPDSRTPMESANMGVNP